MLSYDDTGQMFRIYFDIRPPTMCPLTLEWTWHTLALTLLKRD